MGLAQQTFDPSGPTISDFMRDDSFVVGVMGPIGSGKTTAGMMKGLAISYAQKPDALGRRRSRGAIIRNTYPELTTTSIKSWHEWVPITEGKWIAEGPPRHILNGKDGLQIEVMFLALDRPEDVRKVLSMDLTWAFVNEAREVPKAVIDGLTGRVGRFPSPRDGGCVSPQIIMDTNPPDSDHWWYILAERDSSTPRGKEIIDSIEASEAELRGHGVLTPSQHLFSFHRQPGGRTPRAENLHNLPAAYYTKAAAGKTKDWIKVYVDGEYGFVQDGKPCYPEYVDSTHCRAFELFPYLPLTIGLDFGLTPAATIGQELPNGRHVVRHEIVTERMGATALALELKRFLGRFYPDRDQFPIGCITGDPSGSAGGNDERAVFDILKANQVQASPASTNDFTVRREAVGTAFNRLIDGQPGLLIHPDCRVLRKACQGGYHFSRVKVVGDERWHDRPHKNHFSHVAEALQYQLLGSGAERELRVLKSEPKVKPARPAWLRGIIGGGGNEGAWMG